MQQVGQHIRGVLLSGQCVCWSCVGGAYLLTDRSPHQIIMCMCCCVSSLSNNTSTDGFPQTPFRNRQSDRNRETREQMLKAIIVGNIGSDPEMRYSQDGKGILRFSVASNGRVRQQDGTWTDETTWIRCTVFGPRAEKLSELLRKGSKVFVDGRLEARPWLNNAGQPQAGLEVIANDVEFTSSRQDGPQPAGAALSNQPTADDDGVPF